MVSRKVFIVLISVFSLILLSSFIYEYSPTFHKINLSITGLLYSGKTETNFTSAIVELLKGGDEVLVQTSESNVCYWITPTRDKGYYIEIKKYSSENKECYGKLLEESMIPTDKPINIIGKTNCLCSNEITVKKVGGEKGNFLEIISG
jgi:hypothetical protein